MGSNVFGKAIGSAVCLFVLAACSSSDGDDQLRGVSGAGGSTTGGAAGSSATGGAAGSNATGGAAGSNATGGSMAGSTASAGKGGGGGSGDAGGGGTGETAGSGGASGSPHHLSIRFDYRLDALGFFDAPERRAALEAAGAVWSKLIHDDFPSVPAGSTLMTKNPENRDEYLSVVVEEDIDDLLVFVGSSDAIPGLGRGGPSGTASTGNASMDAALVARRTGAAFQPWAGSITFNPAKEFYFDTTPQTADDIPPAIWDFTSNAAHELGHVLGFGTSDAFTAFVDGTTFTGPAAVASFGGPVPLTSELGHLEEGTQSNGTETLMDSGQANGVRVVPTALDRAVLKDLGYDIEP